jgi:hypothetical protein
VSDGWEPIFDRPVTSLPLSVGSFVTRIEIRDGRWIATRFHCDPSREATYSVTWRAPGGRELGKFYGDDPDLLARAVKTVDAACFDPPRWRS